VPTTTEKSTIELSPAVRYTLADLGIKVSTGPVVDFRLKEHLRDMPEPGTVPLIYPGHLSMTGTVWPVPGLKKPNAILRNEATEKWLVSERLLLRGAALFVQGGKRRVSGERGRSDGLWRPRCAGLREPHQPLFHENKRGLPELLAKRTGRVSEHDRRR
jgi:adenine-specific DNA-methyltransferase